MLTGFIALYPPILARIPILTDYVNLFEGPVYILSYYVNLFQPVTQTVVLYHVI